MLHVSEGEARVCPLAGTSAEVHCRGVNNKEHRGTTHRAAGSFRRTRWRHPRMTLPLNRVLPMYPV